MITIAEPIMDNVACTPGRPREVTKDVFGASLGRERAVTGEYGLSQAVCDHLTALATSLQQVMSYKRFDFLLTPHTISVKGGHGDPICQVCLYHEGSVENHCELQKIS